MQIRNSTPNQIGSMSRRCTIGMNTGKVISIMLTWSTKMPRKIRSSIMPARMAKATGPGQDGRDQPFGGTGEAQDLREGGGAQDDEQDHAEMPTVPRSAFSRASKLSAR